MRSGLAVRETAGESLNANNLYTRPNPSSHSNPRAARPQWCGLAPRLARVRHLTLRARIWNVCPCKNRSRDVSSSTPATITVIQREDAHGHCIAYRASWDSERALRCRTSREDVCVQGYTPLQTHQKSEICKEGCKNFSSSR
jgi:hypothetical protein